MVVMCMLFYLLSVRVLGRQDDPALMKLMSAMSGFIILFCALMGVIAIFRTHRVAGAAYRLERCIRSMTDGNLDLKIALRSKDYLQNLADALGELQDRMKAEAALRAQLSQSLAEVRDGLAKAGKLDSDDHARLTKAIEDLRAPRGPAAIVDKEPSPSV